MRRAAALVALLPVGCFDGQLVRTAGFVSKPVETPTVTPASEATAARVYEVGTKLLVANPFAGVEPTFQVVGSPEPLLFHRDHFGVFISNSLADRCITEEALAGVLAHEMAAIIAERRNLLRMGVEEPPVPTAENEEPPVEPPAKTVAGSDAKAHEDKLRGLPTDPKLIAADLLKSAGYEPSAQSSAESLLKSANRNKAILKQLAGPAVAPKWSN